MLLLDMVLQPADLLEHAVAVGAGQLLAALVDDAGALGAAAAARAAGEAEQVAQQKISHISKGERAWCGVRRRQRRAAAAAAHLKTLLAARLASRFLIPPIPPVTPHARMASSALLQLHTHNGGQNWL